MSFKVVKEGVQKKIKHNSIHQASTVFVPNLFDNIVKVNVDDIDNTDEVEDIEYVDDIAKQQMQCNTFNLINAMEFMNAMK